MDLGGLFWGSFNQTRELMQERAYRLDWQAAQPQIQASVSQAFQPLQEAEAAFQAAKTPEEKTKALSARMTATRDFAMRSMELAARLGASGNPHAQEYAGSLQKAVGEYAQLEMQGTNTLLQSQAQQWDQDFKQKQADAAAGRWQQEQQTEQQRFDAQQKQHSKEFDATQAHERTMEGLDQKRLDIEQQRADNEKKAGEVDPALKRADRIAELLAKRDTLRANGVGEDQTAPIDQALEQFGVKKDSSVELFSQDLEKRRNEITKAMGLAKDPHTRELYQAELKDIENESQRLFNEDAAMRRRSREPGFLQGLLKELEMPPGGMPGS